jgi:hypothetical protein
MAISASRRAGRALCDICGKPNCRARCAEAADPLRGTISKKKRSVAAQTPGRLAFAIATARDVVGAQGFGRAGRAT